MVVSANDRFSAGTLTLEVGALTEEVTVTGRVSELQAESGERSYSLESEAIKNIANNGRALVQLRDPRAGRRLAPTPAPATSGTQVSAASPSTASGPTPTT